MQLYQIIFILFIISKSIQEDCSKIKPTKASDCVLSISDKILYNKCCYEELSSGSKCNVYGDFDWDNKEYQEKLNQYGTNSAKFVCNEISSSNTPEITWKGCEDITPTSASDCVMSKEDKDHNFAYCCYESLGGLIKTCTLETEQSHQDELEYIEFFGLKDDTTYVCSDKVGKSGQSGFINLSMILFVLFLLSI